jgi:peptide/nickel transport system substrate-binding protein
MHDKKKETRRKHPMKKQKIKTYVTISITLINTLLITGCLTPSNHDENTIDTAITIGMTSDVSGFYPWMGLRDTATLSVNKNFYTCLVEMDPSTYKFIPALAEKWNNPNNVTWRFFLRQGVQFHNGDLFDAEDVNFTIDFMRNDSYYQEELDCIVEVQILDNYTLDIITKQPSPMLLYKLGTLYMLSKEYITSTSNSDTNNTRPIGTGPYKLTEYIPRDHITLERFEQYWSKPPDVKQATFKIMNTAEDLKNALKNGDLDIIPLASEDIEEIQNSTGLQVVSVQTPAVVYISFDFRTNDSYAFKGSTNPLSDVRVRTAMYQAIDIDTIIEKYLKNTTIPASQFIAYHTFGYNPKITRLPYDIPTARDLMRQAGYENGFTIQFDTPNSPKWINITQEIAKELSMINITVNLNPQPTNEYYTNLYYKNTSMYLTSFNPIDAESVLNLLLHTSNPETGYGAWNYGNYSNPEVDRLCELLTYTINPEQRGQYLQDAFSSAASDIAWIPLFSPKAFYGTQADIIWKPRPSLFIWIDEISFHQ